MDQSVWQCLLLLVIIHFVSSAYIPYDCRRSSQVCGTAPSLGRCEAATGVCQCANANFAGFDCTLRTDSIVAAGVCNVNCAGTATCYAADGDLEHKCYCDPATYGPTCQFNRVSVQCAGDSMLVRVFPQSFTGEVHVSNLLSVPACAFEPAADGNGLIKNLSLSADNTKNPCSPNLSVLTNNADGTQIFTYELTVRYNTLYTSIVDEVHTTTCQHTTGGPLIGTVINVDGGLVDGVTVEGSVNVVDLDVIRDVDGVSVVQNNIVVGIGDEISLQITLHPDSNYENHRVENCGAYNVAFDPPVNPDRLEKPLVQDGCPASNTLDVVRGPLSKNGNVISLPLSAFKYSTGELYLYCSVRVCQLGTDPLCLPNDCPLQYGGPGSGFGRKKRQANDDGNVEVIQRIFVVSSAEKKATTGALREVIEESCLRSTAFIAVTGVFAALLIIVLAVTIALVVKYIRREKNFAKGKYSDKS